VVYVKHLQQYGFLLDQCAEGYEIELIPHDSNSDRLKSSAGWQSPKETPRSKARRATQSKTAYCTLAQLEVHVPLLDHNSHSQSHKQGGLAAFPPPKSTVGIDIDTWRPFLAHDFLEKYRDQQKEKLNKQEKQQKQEKQEDIVDGSLLEDTTSNQDDSGAEAAESSNIFRNLMESDDDDNTPQNSYVPDPFLTELPAPPDIPSSTSEKQRNNITHPDRICPPKGTPRPPASDLVLSIWDFAGQEIYHSAQEAFFSERALYLVVWNMTKNSKEDMDHYVQFWIDLIQSRAPGSMIIVVATHADQCSKKRRHFSRPKARTIRVNLLQHLHQREESRLSTIKKDLARAVKEGDREQMAQLRYISKNRPIICSVFPVSCTTMNGFKALTAKIISLSTPTKKNKYPFQLVGIPILNFYLKVKNKIRDLRRAENHIVTIHQLQDQLSQIENASEFEDDSLAQKLSQHSENHVRDAISFLASIGEVVWFQPLSANGSAHYKSNLKSNCEKKSNASSESSSEFDSDPLPGSIPQLGTRGVSSTTSSNGTIHSGEEESNKLLWRDVEDLEAYLKCRGDISNMVFLSPHWLINVLKRVLTHHLIETVRDLIASSTTKDLTRYFGGGKNYLERVKNGIVRWSLIEKLMRIQTSSSPSSDADRGKREARKENIVHSLR
jgi:GTPase SAR1 family protein